MVEPHDKVTKGAKLAQQEGKWERTGRTDRRKTTRKLLVRDWCSAPRNVGQARVWGGVCVVRGRGAKGEEVITTKGGKIRLQE